MMVLVLVLMLVETMMFLYFLGGVAELIWGGLVIFLLGFLISGL